MSEGPRKEDFDATLREILAEAKAQGKTTCRVVSKDLHKRVGDWVGNDHRMATACDAMWDIWKEQGGDKSKIIHTTRKCRSSTIELEFFTGAFHWSFSRIMKVIAHGFIGKRLTHKELIK